MNNLDISDILSKVGLHNYKKCELVAKGFEAFLYLVIDSKGQKLALKLYPFLTSQVQNECSILRYLEKYKYLSPKCFQSGFTKNSSFIVLEWKKGISLIEACQKFPKKILDLGF